MRDMDIYEAGQEEILTRLVEGLGLRATEARRRAQAWLNADQPALYNQQIGRATAFEDAAGWITMALLPGVSAPPSPVLVSGGTPEEKENSE